jgi:general secretion pathway protein E
MSNVGESVFEGEAESLILFVEAERTILVSRDHIWQPHVRAAVQRIKSRNPGVKEEPVGIDMLSKRRAEGAGKGLNGGKSTDMQRDAIELFREAVRYGASDIHIRVSKDRCVVLRRVNDELEIARQEPASWGNALCSAIYHSLADVSDPTFEPSARQDARIANKKALPERLEGIRIATTPSVDGYIMVLRLLYDATGATTDLIPLGLEKSQAETVQIIKRRPTGINLISGPTGSGKSTTLQRILMKLIEETKGRKHIITVEDPPEYPIPGAVQTPVTNAQTEELRSLAFQDAIKGAMRVDPDVIMIGEMRDTPSARLAVQAALTGHQVWATVHANGAFYVPDRLIDLAVPKDLIMDPTIVSGLMGQRLMKTMCRHCRQPLRNVFDRYRESIHGFDETLERMNSVLQMNPMEIFVTGDGCAECRETGTSGRTVIAEVVLTDYTLMDLLRKGRTHDAIEYWRRERGGFTMREHAILKVRAGIIDPFVAEDSFGDLDSDAGMESNRVSAVVEMPSRSSALAAA